jgi:ribosome-associated protein
VPWAGRTVRAESAPWVGCGSSTKEGFIIAADPPSTGHTVSSATCRAPVITRTRRTIVFRAFLMPRHSPSVPVENLALRNPDAPAPEEVEVDRGPSKSQKKRDMTALQKLGEELVEYTSERLEKVELSDDLRQAIDDARTIRDHEGRRRQMQYIGRLMRDVDVAPIRAAIDAWAGASREEAAALHALERWRERLLEDDAALTAFATEHTAALSPDTLQRLRNAIRMARKERAESRPPKHFRELFKLIRGAVDADLPPTSATGEDDAR